MTSLLFVPGSRRRESFNTRLLRHLAEQLKGRCVIDVLEPGQVDLPIFDQDLEDSPEIAGRVRALCRRFDASDAIVVASPEYNGQPPPYLTNIVSWVSRLPHIDASCDNPFQDKPALLCSASTGWSGGAVAMPQLRALFAYVGCLVLGDPIRIPYADQAWTGDRYVFDAFFEAEIEAVLGRFLQLAEAACARRQRDAREAQHDGVPESNLALAAV